MKYARYYSTINPAYWRLVHEVAPAESFSHAVDAAVTRLLGDPSQSTFARRAMVEGIVVAGTPAP